MSLLVPELSTLGLKISKKIIYKKKENDATPSVHFLITRIYITTHLWHYSILP